MKLFDKVNDSYFLQVWPCNRWFFGHINIDIWFSPKSSYWSISPSSANDETYYGLHLYFGIVNISYTWLA